MKPKVMELMHTMHKLNKLRLQILPPEGGGAWGSLGKAREGMTSLGKWDQKFEKKKKKRYETILFQIPPPEGGGAWGSLGKPGEAWGSLGLKIGN